MVIAFISGPQWHDPGLLHRRRDETSFSYFYSGKMALSMYRAQPVTREQLPAFYQIVDAYYTRMALPMPRIYVIPPSHPTVAPGATRGTRRLGYPGHSQLAERPRSSKVCWLHELGHVKES